MYTNLPLNVDQIAIHFQEHYPEIPSKTITDKINLIPIEQTKLWMSEVSGPWEAFKDVNLAGCRVIIDEIHNYVHLKSKQEYIHKWRQWLGELRHQGCEFEAISQYETKIHPLIRHECGLKRSLESFDDKRDPVLWIKFYDHFQILSKARGYWSSRVWYGEYKPSSENAHTWEKVGGGTVPLVPDFYRLYNSYSAPIAGTSKGSNIQPHPFQRLKWKELLHWYFRRNITNIVLSMAVYTLLIYLFIFGGIVTIFMSAFTPKKETTQETTKPIKTDKKETNDKVKAPEPKPVPPAKPAIKSPRGSFDASGRPWLPAASGSENRPTN